MRRHEKTARSLGLATLLVFGIISILGTRHDDGPQAPDWRKCFDWNGQLKADESRVEFIKHFYFFLPDGKVYASAYVETQDTVGSPAVTVDNVDVTLGGITGDVRVTVRVILDINEAVDYRPCITANNE